MTEASTLALLSDNQAVVRHNTEDINEIYELLDRLELRASLIEDEEQAAKQLYYQYQKELDEQLKADKELAEELAQVQKVEDEQRQVNEFIKSFEVTRPVQYEGREIIVKINNTRKKEQHLMEELAQEEVRMRADIEKLSTFKQYTIKRAANISRDLQALLDAIEYGSWPESTEKTEESPKESHTDPEGEDRPEPSPKAQSHDESEDVNMEVEIE